MEVPKTLTRNKFLVAIITLATIGILWRLIPHVPNFAPIGAITLTAGTLLSKRASALLLFTIMLITDAVLGFYTGFLWTWLAIALIVPIGNAVKKLPFATKATAGSLSASTIFYIVSNFGVWLTSGMYEHTTAGLLACYALALPFFGTTLVSDFAFSSVLLSLAGYLQRHQTNYKKKLIVSPTKTIAPSVFLK